MKIFIRNHDTGLYYGENGRWTSRLAEARRFKFSACAVEFAEKHHLSDAEVIYDFGAEHECIVIPLTAPLSVESENAGHRS